MANPNKVEWWRWDEINRRRAISLVHYSSSGDSTYCGVIMPRLTSSSVQELNDESMLCRLCVRRHEKWTAAVDSFQAELAKLAPTNIDDFRMKGREPRYRTYGD